MNLSWLSSSDPSEKLVSRLVVPSETSIFSRHHATAGPGGSDDNPHNISDSSPADDPFRDPASAPPPARSSSPPPAPSFTRLSVNSLDRVELTTFEVEPTGGWPWICIVYPLQY